MTDLLITGALVLVEGAVRARDLLLRGDRITAVLPAGDGPPDVPRLDARRRLILPGLVNAHTHGHANIMKGVADRWILESSLTYGSWMAGARDADAIRLSTLLGATEMLENGITAAYDLLYEFPVPTPDGLMAAARAYADLGLRAVIAPMVADGALFEAIPGLLESLPDDLHARVATLSGSTEAILDALRNVVAVMPDLPDGVTLALAPTIPHHCSDAFLRGFRDLAERHGLPIHTHVAESRLQAVVSRELWGHGPVTRLDRFGFLGPRTTLAHGVWLDDGELDLIAARGATLVHLPWSNLRLGAGVAPVRAALSRGVPVALGTDGCNSADSLDILDAARLAAALSRAHDRPREDWIGAAEALRIATEGGATALGLAGETGRIAAGRAADLTLLDLDHRAFTPLNDPLIQAVTCNTAGAVREVFVGGRQVVSEGRALSAAATGLSQRATEAVVAHRHRNVPARALADLLEPHAVAFAEARSRAPFPIQSKIPAR